MLTLANLKKLFKDGMDYANQNSSWFYPPIDDLDEIQNDLVQKATDLTTMVSAVRITNPNIGAAYWTPKPVCDNCMLKNSQPLWGQAPIGWYFFVGNFGNMAYCITFFRIEIAPPQVFKGQNRGDAAVWLIGGGYGSQTQWNVLPYEYIQMKYTPLTYSTFTLVGTGSKYFGDCYLKSTTPMAYTFSVDYKDQKGVSHSVQATQQSLTPPQQAALNGFILGILPGMGSLYWSYTDMDVTFVVNGSVHNNGKGWMDHQNLKLANPTGLIQGSTRLSQVLYTVGKTLAKPSIVGWTWMFIQDMESGIQYMLSTELPKNYHSVPSSFKPGLVLPTARICNIYKEGVPYNNPGACNDVRIEVSKVQIVGGHPYPLEYNITLPGGKQVVSRAVYGLNLFPNGPQVSCESPGVVFDKTGTKKIGYSILEINGPLTFAEMGMQSLVLAGGDIKSQTSMNAIEKGQKGYQPTNRKVVAWLITLLPFIIFVLLIILIFVGKKNRWAKLGLFISVSMVVYSVLLGVIIVSMRQ